MYRVDGYKPGDSVNRVLVDYLRDPNCTMLNHVVVSGDHVLPYEESAPTDHRTLFVAKHQQYD